MGAFLASIVENSYYQCLGIRMKPNNRDLNQLDSKTKLGYLLLFFGLVMGVYLRYIFISSVSFPLNDGGLFYTMIRDLQGNHYILPSTISYNLSDLPFVYSPLSFYIFGWLNSQVGLDLLSIIRWSPFIFNVLTIPAFFLFARRVLNDPVKGGLAAVFFALLKPGYEWLIMGGGLTRSPALLFSILTLDRYLAVIESDKKRSGDVVLSVLFYSLTFLFHMELGWFTTYSLALLWFFKGRSKKNFRISAIIAAGTFIVTSPYWFQIIYRGNLSAFVHGMFSGGYIPFISAFGLFYLNFTEELIFPILAALALLGIIVSVFKKDYLLPTWLVLNSILDSRSVNRSDAIPVSILIAVGLMEGLFLLIQRLKMNAREDNSNEKNNSLPLAKIELLIIFSLCFYVVLNAYLSRFTETALSHVLSAGNQSAMVWVSQNTPPGAAFLALPSSTWWETDAVGEWFPALTGRRNVLTVQGNEWSADYQEKIADYKDLLAEIESGSFDLNAFLRVNPDVSYVYLPLSAYRDSAELVVLRAALAQFPLVFQNEDVEIYRLRTD